MADTYTVGTMYPDTEYLGGTQTRPVTAVPYTTKPHGVYFESRIPDADLTPTEVDNTGKVNSEALENLFNIPGVTAVEWTMVSNPAQYLVDEIIVYYQTPDLNSSGSLTTPFTGISNAVVEPKVAKAIANLVAIENL